MKYFKHIIVNNDVKHFQFYSPEGSVACFPDDPANTDYERMMEEVDAGTSTIEEVDDTPE
jgi:hypothetical protein